LNLPGGLNFNDSQMSLVLSAWTIGGMIASLAGGRLSDKFGRIKILLMGLCFAMVTPLLYPLASNMPLMAIIYGLNGVSFWTIQTVGLVFAGDLIPKDRRGRLLSRFNTVIALSWGPAGFLIGGPLADLQVHLYGMSSYAAYVNVFYLSSIIVLAGTLLFVLRVARSTRK
jgi:MFS family permease